MLPQIAPISKRGAVDGDGDSGVASVSIGSGVGSHRGILLRAAWAVGCGRQWIPACAGMTVNKWGMAVNRPGNDGDCDRTLAAPPHIGPADIGTAVRLFRCGEPEEVQLVVAGAEDRVLGVDIAVFVRVYDDQMLRMRIPVIRV